MLPFYIYLTRKIHAPCGWKNRLKWHRIVCRSSGGESHPSPPPYPTPPPKINFPLTVLTRFTSNKAYKSSSQLLHSSREQKKRQIHIYRIIYSMWVNGKKKVSHGKHLIWFHFYLDNNLSILRSRECDY